MRAFLGIALPPAIRSSLATIQRELAATGADVKWTEPDNLHVTLRFLGEISDAARKEIEKLLVRVAQRHRAFDMELHGLGAFPSVGSPRVVWVGVREGSGQVVRIADEIEEGLRQLGIEPEERACHPHATLGRVRSPKRRTALSDRLRGWAWDALPFCPVTAVTFFQSSLTPAGPIYTVLAAPPLTNVSSAPTASADPAPPVLPDT